MSVTISSENYLLEFFSWDIIFGKLILKNLLWKINSGKKCMEDFLWKTNYWTNIFVFFFRGKLILEN